MAVLLGDVGDGLVHAECAIGVGMEELCSAVGMGVVCELAYAAAAREQVGTVLRFADVVVAVACSAAQGTVYAAGWDDAHALVGSNVVGRVLFPGLCVVVNMVDEQSVAGGVSVHVLEPSLWLSVFENEVFVGVALVADDVSYGCVLQGWHVLYGGGAMEGGEFEPSCHPSFVGSVACWAFAVSVCAVVGT